MTKKITAFASRWVSNNIHDIGYHPSGSVIKQHASNLVDAAVREGISKSDLVKAIGNPADYVAEAIDSNTDNEVDRMVARDD